MPAYKKFTKNGNKIQVESAIRDGNGVKIDTNYAKQDGNYPTLTSGFSENLTPYGANSGVQDNTPFIFQTAGGESEIGVSAQIQRLFGKSVQYNQKFNNVIAGTTTYSSTNGIITTSEDKTSGYVLPRFGNFIAGHKYFTFIETDATLGASQFYTGWTSISDSWSQYSRSRIYTPQQNYNNVGIVLNVTSFTTSNYLKLQVFDLTAMGITATTVDEAITALRALGIEPTVYNPYNAGSLISTKVKGYKEVGYNAWDEEWEVGSINLSTGQNADNANKIRSKNYTRVVPNTVYYFKQFGFGGSSVWNILYYDKNNNYISYGEINVYGSFTTPSNCYYIRFRENGQTYGTTYKNDICIFLYWDGSRIEYEPYKSITYDMPNVVLRSAGSVKDELLPDGTLIRRVGVVDLGTLSWNKDTYTFDGVEVIGWYNTTLKNTGNFIYNKPTWISDKYAAHVWTGRGVGDIVADGQQNVFVFNNSNDKPSGTLYFELITPTTETVSSYQENTVIDNWGTQEWLSDETIIIPQPADFFYSVDYKAFVDSAGGREDINYDAEQIVSHEQFDPYVDGTEQVGKSRLANNFDSKLVINDKTAYTFRTTAGGEEVGDPAKVKSIIGGTVFWNQLVQNGNFASDSGWTASGTSSFSVLNNVATFLATSKGDMLLQSSINFLSDHKYLFTVQVKLTTGTNEVYLRSQGTNRASTTSKTSWQTLTTIYESSASGSSVVAVMDYRTSDWDNIQIRNFQLIDLTTLFGSTVANYIYSLEQATTGAGVAWFKKYFPKEYYAYSAPTPMHVKISGIRMNRFNQWDEEWEVGGYNTSTGAKSGETNRIRCKNKIAVSPNTVYHLKTGGYNCVCLIYDKNETYLGQLFTSGSNPKDSNVTTPANGYYMAFYMYNAYGTTYKNDICINFHWDGERDGEYEPYYTQMYPVDDIELKGIPMVDTDGNLYFDGDAYWSDGTVDGNYGIVDLGTLTWTAREGDQFSTTLPNDCKTGFNFGVICSKYPFLWGSSFSWAWTNLPDKSLGKASADSINIRVHDSAYSGYTASQFATAMSGVYLVYQKETPTQSTATPFLELQERDNWGAEEIIDAHTGDVALPTSVNTDYLPDLKAKLESAPANPDNDGDYVMHREDGENSYAPLGTWLTAQGYKKASELPTVDAVGGTLRQCLCVKESLDFDDTAYVDLGDLNWISSGSGNRFYTKDLEGIIDASSYVYGSPTDFMLCSNYKNVSWQSVVQEHYDMTISCADNGDVSLVNAYAGTLTSKLKTALKGVLLAYKKA